MKKKPNFQVLQRLSPSSILTRSEAADLLGMTTPGIAQRIRRGLMLAQKVGGTWYIYGADILDQVFCPPMPVEGDPEAIL